MAEVENGAGMSALRRALAEDLHASLVRGAERDRQPNAVGDAWLIRAGLTALVLGAALWSLAGYHAFFPALNGAAALLPSALWQWLTVLGDERVACALSLFFARRHPRVFWTLICAALLAALYSRGLKPLVDALRPPAVLAADGFNLIGPGRRSHSFPSGHSVTAGVFFGVLVYYAGRLPWRVLFLVLGVLAGLSRIAVGVHWPVDVACGLGGGFLAAWLGVRLALRAPWGLCDVSVHMAVVTLAAIASVALWFDDGGYVAAALPLQALSVTALGFTAWVYLLLPLWRVRR
jgi:membrane-associated phospholipid phosphatase